VLHIYRRHYNEHRPHCALQLLPPNGATDAADVRVPNYTVAICSATSSTNTRLPEFVNPTRGIREARPPRHGAEDDRERGMRKRVL
jgi:hypothetical protein